MKKTYEKPMLTTEKFDVEDVITASSAGSGSPTTLNQVGNGWEVPGFSFN